MKAQPGDRYGRLVVQGEAQRLRPRVRIVEVRCDCGASLTVRVHSLQSGSTKSCGCLNSDARKRKRPIPVAEVVRRFWSNVDKNGPVPAHQPELGPCWVWLASARSSFGYGAFSMNRRRYVAHRAAWLMSTGPIPDGMSVLHRCDNPPCVNPDHLFLGTLSENTIDMFAKKRQGPRLRHPRGVRSPGARLNDELVASIRQRCEAGESQASIARQLGVHPSTISLAVTGRRWAHVVAPKEAAL